MFRKTARECLYLRYNERPFQKSMRNCCSAHHVFGTARLPVHLFRWDLKLCICIFPKVLNSTSRPRVKRFVSDEVSVRFMCVRRHRALMARGAETPCVPSHAPDSSDEEEEVCGPCCTCPHRSRPRRPLNAAIRRLHCSRRRHRSRHRHCNPSAS